MNVPVKDRLHSRNQRWMFCDWSHTNCAFVGGSAHDQLEPLKLWFYFFWVRSAASVCRMKTESGEWVAHFSGR